jgi:sulfur-oxidizing protein SoxB
VVAKHLKAGKPSSRSASGVTLKGVDGNPGIAGHG